MTEVPWVTASGPWVRCRPNCRCAEAALLLARRPPPVQPLCRRLGVLDPGRSAWTASRAWRCDAGGGGCWCCYVPGASVGAWRLGVSAMRLLVWSMIPRHCLRGRRCIRSCLFEFVNHPEALGGITGTFLWSFLCCCWHGISALLSPWCTCYISIGLSFHSGLGVHV